METRHIRLDYEEAIEAKKQLLSSELNLLYMIKRLKAYKLLRKKEILTKVKLKSHMNSLKAKVNLMKSTFPKQGTEEVQLKKREVEKGPSKEIQKELEDIQKKLAKLG